MTNSTAIRACSHFQPGDTNAATSSFSPAPRMTMPARIPMALTLRRLKRSTTSATISHANPVIRKNHHHLPADRRSSAAALSYVDVQLLMLLPFPRCVGTRSSMWWSAAAAPSAGGPCDTAMVTMAPGGLLRPADGA